MMELVLNEIFNEIKKECNENTFQHLKNFITVKLFNYDIREKETQIIKYEMNENERLLKMFLISKKLQGLSDRSLKYYNSEIEKFIKEMNKNVKEITSDDVKYFLACYQLKGTVSSVAVDNKRRILSTFFQWLSDEEHILKNPLRKIKKVKVRKKIKKAFSNEDIEKLKIECEKLKKEVDRKRAISIIETLLSTGVRAEELSNIKIKDIDFDKREICILGKGNKERKVYLTEVAALRILDYLNSRNVESEYLYISIQSPYNKIKVSGLETFLKKLGKNANVENVHPHRFRRTFATIANKRGMPIQEISRILGHEDLRTTQIYINLDDEDVQMSHKKYMN